MDLSELTIVVRLAMAALFSGVLGIERTRKRRAAGLRTYMLVCIGATIVTITQQFMVMRFGGDPGRIPAQVISGIGFLGAGTIMVTRYRRVKGLTTAAGLWAAACMGLAIGIGFYSAAITTCVVLLFVMVFADKMENHYTRRLSRLPLFIIFSNIVDIKPFMNEMRQKEIELTDVETTTSDDRQGIGLFCVLELPSPLTRESAFRLVEDAGGVLFAEELND